MLPSPGAWYRNGTRWVPWQSDRQHLSRGAQVSNGQRSDPVVSHPPQPRIVARLTVTAPDLFRLVFRYVNRGPTSVNGRVSVREEGRLSSCVNCEWSLFIHCFSTPHCTSQAMQAVDPTCVIVFLALHPLGDVHCTGEVQPWGGVARGLSAGLLPSDSRHRAKPASSLPTQHRACFRHCAPEGLWGTLCAESRHLDFAGGGRRCTPGEARATAGWGQSLGPQSLGTYLPPLPGLCGATAEHLLRGSSPTASSNRGLYLPALSRALHREVRSRRMGWGWILGGPMLTSISVPQLPPPCSSTPGWLPFSSWN